MEAGRAPSSSGWAAVAGISLAGIAFAALVLAAVAVFGPPPRWWTATPVPPSAPLTQSEAIDTALRVALPSDSEPTVVWARLSSDSYAGGYGSTRGLVWLVRLEGAFEADYCQPYDDPADWPVSGRPCIDGSGGMVLVLDAYTGALLGWTH